MKMLHIVTAFLAVSFASVPQAPAAARKTEVSLQSNGAPVVRVNAVNQGFDFARPWQKKNPYARRGTGAVLASGRVLVTAELVADNNLVEVEIPRTGQRIPAEIVALDYDANLALLEPEDPGPVNGLGAFSLDRGARVGDRADILQVENNGEIARTAGTVTTIGVFPYPNETLAALMFKMSAPLQSRDSSFVLPAERDGRLLGLLMRYDARTQTADLVPAPVITRFLEFAENGGGFPKAGVTFSTLRDPGLREHLGVPREGGVFVTDILAGSPAEKAGLRRGDVILGIDGRSLDQDGMYVDPQFGKILFSHLVAMKEPGEGMDFEVWRDGTLSDIELIPEVADPDDVVSRPYLFDQAPRFVVLGGLIFQELSRGFLRQWGGNWRDSAPQHLVYLDAFQSELPADRGKIVFLSGILPSDETLGYNGLENLVVTKVNNKEIRGLEDLLAAAQSPQGRFHKIEFEEDPGAIYLDAESIKASRDQLAEDYGIPEMTNLPEAASEESRTE
jgi:S1-C subfamily serine protease